MKTRSQEDLFSGKAQMTAGADDPDKRQVIAAIELGKDLLSRCERLLTELEEFKNFIAEAKKGNNSDDGALSNVEHVVETRQFSAAVVAEEKSLRKVMNQVSLFWHCEGTASRKANTFLELDSDAA